MVVVERAGVTVVGHRRRLLVQPAAPVLVVLGVVLARPIVVPRANAVNRLGACCRRALDIVVSKRTGIPVVSSRHRDTVSAAFFVLVVLLMVLARGVSSEGTHAVHRLSTASRDLLLVVVSQRTSLTVVGRKHTVLVEAMPEVLVLDAVMVAAGVRTIGTHTINRLGALVLRALHLAVRVRTSLTIQVGRSGNHVGTATLILVVGRDILAAAIGSPLALAVHGLAAATLGAMLEVMGMRTSIAVVKGHLRHLVEAAPLVLMVILVVVARSIRRPGTNAIHGLRAATLVPLLVKVAIGATETVVRGIHRDLVVPGTPVLVVLSIVLA